MAFTSGQIAQNLFSSLAYADASDGVTASTINTDFVELEVELKVATLPAGYATKAFTPYKLA
ncbi:hypothetical protein [Aneurinibacillus tyrosinisolvens]|uniref:hypothetical protein n=1 Tax=Aneurinibacillus tyrosinisolvens TaxID=1443435 RepID=UPI000A515121|nr:hypothetical protein [Aneurinibacillus tyrosinisolvens]